MPPATRTRIVSGPLAALVVAALMVTALMVLTACGLVTTGPRAVTLAELAADQDRYDGTVVSTEGVVRSFDDPLHYWIEDEDVNRVELVPHDEVAPLLGEEVRVVGEFTFDRDQGRLITVDRIEPIDATSRALRLPDPRADDGPEPERRDSRQRTDG